MLGHATGAKKRTDSRYRALLQNWPRLACIIACRTAARRATSASPDLRIPLARNPSALCIHSACKMRAFCVQPLRPIAFDQGIQLVFTLTQILNRDPHQLVTGQFRLSGVAGSPCLGNLAKPRMLIGKHPSGKSLIGDSRFGFRLYDVPCSLLLCFERF